MFWCWYNLLKKFRLLQYGLYSSFIGCFIYTLFGSIKDITIGPTALMALMTYQQINNRNVDYAIFLCFLSGVVQLMMAILHLGRYKKKASRTNITKNKGKVYWFLKVFSKL